MMNRVKNLGKAIQGLREILYTSSRINLGTFTVIIWLYFLFLGTLTNPLSSPKWKTFPVSRKDGRLGRLLYCHTMPCQAHPPTLTHMPKYT